MVLREKACAKKQRLKEMCFLNKNSQGLGEISDQVRCLPSMILTQGQSLASHMNLQHWGSQCVTPVKEKTQQNQNSQDTRMTIKRLEKSQHWLICNLSNTAQLKKVHGSFKKNFQTYLWWTWEKEHLRSW